MVCDGHPQSGGFGRQVAPDAAHAEDAEGFAEGVVAEGGGRCAAPGAGAEGEDGGVEVAEGGEEEEEGGVGGCGGEGGGRGVGDVDFVGGAGGDVDSGGVFIIILLVRKCCCCFFLVNCVETVWAGLEVVCWESGMGGECVRTGRIRRHCGR